MTVQTTAVDLGFTAGGALFHAVFVATEMGQLADVAVPSAENALVVVGLAVTNLESVCGFGS